MATKDKTADDKPVKAKADAKPKAGAKLKGAGGSTAKTDKPNALQTPVNISDDLVAIVGKGPMPRGEVTSKLWDYIKAHKLQSKEDGRQIVPDAKLGKVIGTEEISMFKMTAAVNKHFS